MIALSGHNVRWRMRRSFWRRRSIPAPAAFTPHYLPAPQLDQMSPRSTFWRPPLELSRPNVGFGVKATKCCGPR
jgi:hypothetical protein